MVYVAGGASVVSLLVLFSLAKTKIGATGNNQIYHTTDPHQKHRLNTPVYRNPHERPLTIYTPEGIIHRILWNLMDGRSEFSGSTSNW